MEELKDELAARDETLNLEMSIALTIWLDNCVRERQRERVRASHVVSPTILDRLSGPAAEPPMPSLVVPPSVVAVDPMQLGQTRISHSERQRRLTGKDCLYCGQPGHFTAACLAWLLSAHDSVSISFLIDFGADDNFIEQEIATQANIPTEVLFEPKTILSLSREILAKITL